jgi:hypothetical protein
VDYFLTQCELFGGQEQDGPSQKTSLDSSPQKREETLLLWLEKWLGYGLTYRTVDGQTPVFSQAQQELSSGQFWMRNSSEFRNDGGASSLSEILETGPIDNRYYLSQKACRGILRRAEKRGKELPGQLRVALESVAGPIPLTEAEEDLLTLQEPLEEDQENEDGNTTTEQGNLFL